MATTPETAHYRLYFLVPGLDCARRVVDVLVGAGIGWQQLQVVSKQGMPLPGVPEARLLRRTALREAAARGLKIGLVGGAAVGVAMTFELHLSLTSSCVIVIIAALLGCGVGSWISAMMGISRPKGEISAYQARVDQGELLVMADVPGDTLAACEQLIEQQLPTVHIDRRALTVHE